MYKTRHKTPNHIREESKNEKKHIRAMQWTNGIDSIFLSVQPEKVTDKRNLNVEGKKPPSETIENQMKYSIKWSVNN